MLAVALAAMIAAMVCIPVSAGAGSGVAIGADAVEDALKRLDRELKSVDVYKQRREARIDSVKILRNRIDRSEPRWLDCTMEIARSYNSFNNDSALAYYTEGLAIAEKVGSDSLIAEFRVRRATYLALSGYIHDALFELGNADTLRFDRGLWRMYHDATRQMFSYISTYYDGHSEQYDYWRNRSMEAQRRLLPLLDEGSDEYLLNLGEYYFSRREYARSREVLKRICLSSGQFGDCRHAYGDSGSHFHTGARRYAFRDRGDPPRPRLSYRRA